MTEFDLIRKLIPGLASNSQVVLGAGHDCAVLDLEIPEKLLLFKTDAVVEDVHFTSTANPGQIGRKALGRPLSDIAAMAGEPSACLVTIGLPDSFDEAMVLAIYRGINSLAIEFGVAVVGGETTTSNKIFISISLLGSIPRNRLLSRKGAQAGDAIFVTGTLGGSLAGRHFDFTPRIREAQWLASHFQLHSMMDLSDGLAGDLRHLLAASHVGAELLAPAIPISRAAKINARSESSAKPPLLAALTDGEDFELLLTLPAGQAVALLDSWKLAFPTTPITCIGKITAEPGLRIRDKQGVRELEAHGYSHFAKS